MIFLFIFSDLSFHLLITIDYTGYKPKKNINEDVDEQTAESTRTANTRI